MIQQGELTWMYYRDLHAIAGLVANRERPAVAFDLGETGAGALTSSRATRAAGRADAGIRPYSFAFSPVWTSPTIRRPDPPASHSLRLDSRSGTLHFQRDAGDVGSLTPLEDGRPALYGGQLVRALQGGDILAILVVQVANPALYFLSVSRSRVVGAFPLTGGPGRNRVCLDPRWSAVRAAARQSPAGSARRTGRSAAAVGHSPRKHVDSFRDLGSVVFAGSRIRSGRASDGPMFAG